MVKRSFVLFASLLAACSTNLDDSASADDIQLSIPHAKLAVKQVKPLADASLKLSKAPRFEQPTTVVLELEGDPVAVVRGNSPGRQLAMADRLNIESALSARQDALIGSIEARGGTVLAKFQHAINGIKVRATPEKIAELATLPGVIAVKPVAIHKRLNAVSVPYIGAPLVWDGKAGFRGEGIKIAIIDTGIDYTHANFGGPGTPDAYNAAFATDTLPADPTMFGPNAPKVKGGIDLVGDDYNPSNPQALPVPDPNPLDCGAHGSHVAGTVAGFGVLADGTTYKGPYAATTDSSQQWAIGPGVAPKADLYAVRVFGCSGATDVVVDALDWAVKNDMDVVNMSLGSPFGAADDADAEASANAAKAGVIVVAAAGNEGPGFYITGSPAGGNETISVAAMDSNDPQSYPGVTVNVGSASIIAQNSNNAAYNGTPLQTFVLPDGNGGVSLGCDETEYVDAQIAGKLVVTLRGVCARILRAQLAFKHGAAAVAMINNGPGYPYFEGDIPTADNTGVVTIPFLGVLASDAPALTGVTSAALGSAVALANPAWHAFADFSSGGPRTGDGFLKPDISAPGVNITSTEMGSGNQGVAFSGTSMATPHVAGVAALVLESHPGWAPWEVRTAILNTADASKILGFQVRLGGSGLVQPFPASRTSAIAVDLANGSANLSYGVAEFTSDYRKTKTIRVQNNGSKALTFSVSTTNTSGVPATVTVWPQDLYVPAGGSKTVDVTLIVPAAKVGDSSDFREVAGLVVLTPDTGKNGGASLTVPYYLVPRARSLVRTGALSGSFGPGKPKSNLKVYNDSHFVSGTVDLYAWGIAGTNAKAGQVGLRAVGVQANAMGGDQLLFFAVNTFTPWSNNAENEFDLLVDTNGDGKPDYAVVAADQGYLTTGTPVGQMVTAVINLNTGAGQIQYPVVTPTDGSTLLIPVFASDIGVTAASPRFSYSVQSFSGTGASDVSGWAMFNAFNNSITTASYVALDPGQHSTIPLVIDPKEWKQTPALGVMVVGLENYNDTQGKLLSITAPAAAVK